MFYNIDILFYIYIHLYGNFSWVTVLKVQNENFVTQIFSKLSDATFTTQISQLNVVHDLISMNMNTLSQLDFVRLIPVYVAVGLFIYSTAVYIRYPEVN
jgi:hypothetical protein